MTKLDNTIVRIRTTSNRTAIENTRKILNGIPGGELVPCTCVTDLGNGLFKLDAKIKHFQMKALDTVRMAAYHSAKRGLNYTW